MTRSSYSVRTKAYYASLLLAAASLLSSPFPPRQVSRFSSINSCAYQGASSDTVDYCYSSAQLYGVNPRSPLEGQPALQQALGSALCVTKKNNAYMVRRPNLS